MPIAEKYFTTDASRRCAPTAYAKARGATTSDSYTTESGEPICEWWLRTPGNTQYQAATGSIEKSFFLTLGFTVGNDEVAVRPTVWIHFDD